MTDFHQTTFYANKEEQIAGKGLKKNDKYCSCYKFNKLNSF